jgi:hypothetical protein
MDSYSCANTEIYFRLLSSELWHHAVLDVDTKVLKVHAALTFSVEYIWSKHVRLNMNRHNELKSTEWNPIQHQLIKVNVSDNLLWCGWKQKFLFSSAC